MEEGRDSLLGVEEEWWENRLGGKEGKEGKEGKRKLACHSRLVKISVTSVFGDGA
jgi:hypothetical protein